MPPAGRYVILHHTGWIQDHFDLMLAADEAGPLHTWRLDRWPDPTRIDRLADHRRAYLDYEGPVSDNRGQVRRVQAGVFDVVTQSPDALTIRLDGDATIALPLLPPHT